MSLDPSKTNFLPAAGEGGEDGGIDLLALAVALLSQWRLVLITFVIVSGIGVAYVYTLKPQYVATATFLPQEGHGNADTLASLFSSRGPGALYVGLLRSRSVQDNVIDRLNLMSTLHIGSRETARDVLAGKSSFSEGADSLITISVRDGNAQSAADLANSYLVGLGDLNDKMGSEQSSQTRRFFEHQLDVEREALANAEAELAKTQRSTGLIVPEAQTSIGISNIASIRQQITALQVQLAALLRGATEQNPQVQVVRSQLTQLEIQERLAENGGGSTPAGAAPSAMQMPQNNLNLQRVQREVKYHDALVTSLANQFESARLNEASARSVFQVVDRAIAPEGKAWPPRKPYLMACLAFGLIMGFVVAVLRLVYGRVAADPLHRKNLATLGQAFRMR